MSSIALPRPVERVAIVSLVLVFLCGGVAGALVMEWGEHTGFFHSKVRQPNSLDMSGDRWRKELNLSDRQARELNSILDDVRRYYDNVVSDGQTRIRQILNPEQRRKFDQMIEARRAH